MNRSNILLSIILLFAVATTALAQPEISPERKQAIDSLALEKVKDLGKYISIIGNKDTPFSEANRVIDRALELGPDDVDAIIERGRQREILAGRALQP